MIDHLKNLPSEETPPKAGAMINTFRAFGYNLQTAIADIIDNSISAKAENIWINYEWNGENSWVSITDDGTGMDKHTLIEAMTPGSKDPSHEREEHDLGRFGLGLKTASFSQCRGLTVITKKKDHSMINRHWDLDYVNLTGKWNLLDYLPNQDFAKYLQPLDHGTTVLWQKMDRLVGNASEHDTAARSVFLEEFELVEEHLSLVFHRYIDRKKINIWINDHKIDSWDPFLKELPGTQKVANESLDNGQVKVKCYVLPHISKLNEEERLLAKTERWYDLQGFYIYRNNRLLLFGDWLGLFSKNEHFKNARILVDIPNSLDHEWKIDIKKATATPSVRVRKDLQRLGKLTRKNAGAVHRFRGNQIMLDDSIQSFSFQPLWKARKTRDEARHYYINTNHPLIEELLNSDCINKSELQKVLKLIGETTPVESIIQFNSEDPEGHELRDKSKDPDSGTIELAKKMYGSLKSTGLSKEVAIKQIFNIEPFNQYTQLVEYFD
ncbi:ATP-binding protein [Christiangramia crocea]|uniref:ATP-binding protein n=1 Tax=Christiangramia crocea TaxID=2904124 RepID=A0A9X1UUW8_9FLAO|nr:ATP-binding protein [Gramella crocea]MCG9970730.1 ATP-binding protein [Gramella crocea]